MNENEEASTVGPVPVSYNAVACIFGCDSQTKTKTLLCIVASCVLPTCNMRQQQKLYQYQKEEVLCTINNVYQKKNERTKQNKTKTINVNECMDELIK